MQVGRKNRSVGATLMNQDSSRSHSIFTITIEIASLPAAGAIGVTDESEDGGADKPPERHIRVGKLNFVDLAGSERQVL